MKPDFSAIFDRLTVNERWLRAGLESCDSVGGQSIDLLKAYNEAVERLMDVTLYLNENEEEEGSSSATSSLRDILDGEGAEKSWEQLVRDNPWLENPPPDGVV